MNDLHPMYDVRPSDETAEETAAYMHTDVFEGALFGRTLSAEGIDQLRQHGDHSSGKIRSYDLKHAKRKDNISTRSSWVSKAYRFKKLEFVWPDMQSPPSIVRGESSFALSAETLGLMRSAIVLYNDEKLPHADRLIVPGNILQITDADLTEIVFEQLGLIFATLARRLARKGKNCATLTSFSEFRPEIDILIQSRVPFPPRYMGHLSDQILGQMQNQAILDAMSGNWGVFTKDISGEIFMVIQLEAPSAASANAATVEIEEY